MNTAADYRPYPRPCTPWMLRQTWSNLLFAHWPVAPAKLERLLPLPLPLDRWEGQAWIGVVPFSMSDVRPRGVPAVPGLSAFPELNVRTYVTLDGRPGVIFFSLDAGSRGAVALARQLFHLPYYHAAMSSRDTAGGWTTYQSVRSRRGTAPPTFRGRYRPTGPAAYPEPGTLEYFLTARYCLYTIDSRRRLYRAEIDHAPWPLQPAEAEIAENTMTRPLGIAGPTDAPVLHFARRLDVVAWAPRGQ